MKNIIDYMITERQSVQLDKEEYNFVVDCAYNFEKYIDGSEDKDHKIKNKICDICDDFYGKKLGRFGFDEKLKKRNQFGVYEYIQKFLPTKKFVDDSGAWKTAKLETGQKPKHAKKFLLYLCEDPAVSDAEYKKLQKYADIVEKMLLNYVRGDELVDGKYININGYTNM